MKLLKSYVSIVVLGMSLQAFSPLSYAADIDPWEPANRFIFACNKRADKYLIKPVTQGYYFITPALFRAAVHNFFSNLLELPTIGNNILQLEGAAALKSTSRFLLNTTFGLGGLGDPATQLGIEQHRKDFGQTLSRWGYTNSHYLILPLLGPSTIRDALGIGVDYFMTPYAYIDKDQLYYGLFTLGLIQKRSEFLEQEKSINAVAVDEYILVRDAYFQRRQYLMTNGVESPDLENY
jgi:phospholipid-binding lipoprotein MlaA